MRRRFTIAFSASLVLVLASLAPAAHAAIPSNDFSLEVSPSPLVATVKPGKNSELQLKVHNAGRKTEQLKIEIRSFSIEHPSEAIRISTTPPPDLSQWVHFSTPTFSAAPGEWVTQKVNIALPAAAGFSYPFVIVISRQNEEAVISSGQLIEGSIGVFTLINVDKPGATRQLELDSLTTDHTIYEYLPTKITVKFKNTGNSIVQPYGNIYIQRGSNDPTPLAVLPVNEERGYILPDNNRSFTASWADGFPAYKTSAPDKDGKTTQSLDWNLQHGSDFRFGRYTAKIVAVYNDGTRDVPIIKEVTFWVIPWRILLGALVVILLIGFALWTLIRKILTSFKRKPPPSE